MRFSVLWLLGLNALLNLAGDVAYKSFGQVELAQALWLAATCLWPLIFKRAPLSSAVAWASVLYLVAAFGYGFWLGEARTSRERVGLGLALAGAVLLVKPE